MKKSTNNDHLSLVNIKRRKYSPSSLLLIKHIFVLFFGLWLIASLFITSIASASTLPPGISFFNNWAESITGPGKWRGIQVMANDRYQRVPNTGQVGQYAVRVEVRPGDDPINASGERAESLTMTDQDGNPIYENEASGTQYYAFSIQLPSNWVRPVHYGICFQLHGPDTYIASSVIAIEATDAFYLDIQAGDLDTPAATFEKSNIPLSDGSLNLGHWVDFVLKIKYAKDSTGAIDIWRRNEGNVQFTQVLALNNIPTLQYKSSMGEIGKHYWKYGYYRSDQNTVTNILLLGAMARGTTFENVIGAAFLTAQNQRSYIPLIKR
jgi:hypothetical protein